MNEPIQPPALPHSCPGCRKVLQPDWVVCPFCGLRLRPGDDLLWRSVTWLAVLVAFVVGISKISEHDPDAAAGLGMIVGLPLAYVFGKAVLFRLRGSPLTWSQLWHTGFKAGMMTVLMLVVIPMVIGVALLLFAFVACGVMMGLGR